MFNRISNILFTTLTLSLSMGCLDKLPDSEEDDTGGSGSVQEGNQNGQNNENGLDFGLGEGEGEGGDFGTGPTSGDATGEWVGAVDIDGQQASTYYNFETASSGFGALFMGCPDDIQGEDCAWFYPTTLSGSGTMSASYGPSCAILIGPNYEDGVEANCPDATDQLQFADANTLQGTFLGYPLVLQRATSSDTSG